MIELTDITVWQDNSPRIKKPATVFIRGIAYLHSFTLYFKTVFLERAALPRLLHRSVVELCPLADNQKTVFKAKH